MPIDNKPLPPIILRHEAEDFLSPNVDVMAQAREATYSPSPLLRILQDPSLMPSGSTENLRKGHKRPSHSPRRREHRTPIVTAIAIAEEERHGKHLKALLRSSSDHLEHEIRRANDATVRADFAERREREALARAEDAEIARDTLQDERMHLEKDTREYQMQMEASQREKRQLEEDLTDARREMEELEYSERKAQETVRKYQAMMNSMEKQIRVRATEVQKVVDQCYEDGREDGYEDGYRDGREAGLKEGLKKGRKEGLRQGREQGRRTERWNAMEAFDKFLVEETNDQDEQHRSERTRRWAQSIHKAEKLEGSESGSQQGEYGRDGGESP